MYSAICRSKIEYNTITANYIEQFLQSDKKTSTTYKGKV